MPLTDVAIRNSKPRDKPYKVGDTLGLFLLVQPSGGKLWRVKYRIDGKEKKLAIGIYPQVGLAEARRRRDAARELVAAGKDPGREKQREKVRSRIQAETTFDAIAAEFCQKRRRDGQKAWAVSTATRSEYLLSLLKGSIGKLPITDIEPADVLTSARSSAKASWKAPAAPCSLPARCSAMRSLPPASLRTPRATCAAR